MSKFHYSYKTFLVIGILLFSFGQAGCSRDPNVRKQKFLAQGNQAFQKGDFSVAAISYGRAIQIDPRFAEAHFKLAQTRMKMNSWAEAYRELKRTIEIEPENWPAQLGLAQLELAGGKRQEARDRALLICTATRATQMHKCFFRILMWRSGIWTTLFTRPLMQFLLRLTVLLFTSIWARYNIGLAEFPMQKAVHKGPDPGGQISRRLSDIGRSLSGTKTLG